MKFKSHTIGVIAAATLLLISVGSAMAGLFSSGWDDDTEKSTACVEAIRRDPALRELHVKFAATVPTFEQLADESLPTEEEVLLLRGRIERMRACRELYRAAVVEHHPFMSSAMEQNWFQQDVVLVELVKRRMTWGNANRLIREARLAFEQRWDAYAQASNDEQRRAIARSLEEGNKQIVPPTLPGNGRVTCRWIGPTLYCDPY